MLILVRCDANVLLVDETKPVISKVLVLILVRCDANVLLVDVIRFVRLLVFVFMSPRCDVNVELVFKAAVFKAFCVAVDMGLFRSDVLLTLPKPTDSFDTP